MVDAINSSHFPYGDVFTTSGWHQKLSYVRDFATRLYPGDVDESRHTVLQDGENDGCYAPCTVKIESKTREYAVADLSSRMEVDGEQLVLLYRPKGPGEALNISAICAVASLVIELPLGTVYHVLRIAFSLVYFVIGTPIMMLTESKSTSWEILDREWSNLGERVEHSLWHIISGPFFAIATAFAHVLVIVESVLTGYIATDPLNARKLAVRVMSAWNDNKPLSEVWWSVGGPGKNFKWLTDKHYFVFPGCYFPMAAGVLSKDGKKVESVRSFSGKLVGPVEGNQEKYNPCPCYYPTPKID